MTDWYVSGLNNKQLRKNQIYSLWINEIIEQWKFQHKITLAVDNECRRSFIVYMMKGLFMQKKSEKTLVIKL